MRTELKEHIKSSPHSKTHELHSLHYSAPGEEGHSEHIGDIHYEAGKVGGKIHTTEGTHNQDVHSIWKPK